MIWGDAAEVVLAGAGAHATEEHANLGLPAPEVGTQDRRLVGVSELCGAKRLDPSADSQLALSGSS
jgi:hypothetical protein